MKRCLDTGWVSSAGKCIDEFEQNICKYVGARYAVACVNGSAGLQVALELIGVAPGDEVIVPTLTFIAPVNAVRYRGAEPVFMDCDDHMNLDCDKLNEFCQKECKITGVGLKNKKSGRPIKAIVPVHIFGNPCDMEGLMRVAQRYGLKVIEDSAESIGAFYVRGSYKGRFAGTIGDVGVFSFNGNKIITCGGGGALVTDNPAYAKKAKYLTNQAKDDSVRYIHNHIGYNFRLTNIQASLGLAQLENLRAFINRKKANYENYKKLLNNIKGISLMEIPEGTSPNYWFYSLIIDKKRYGLGRDELMRRLAERNIQTRPIWYLNHRQRPYRNNQAYRIEKAVWFWERVLNIPCSTNLKGRQVRAVAEAIRMLRS